MTSATKPPSGGATSLARRALTVTGVVIVVVVLVMVLWRALEVLLLMFAAVLVAVLLRFMSGVISRRTRLGDFWSLSLVLALLLGASTAAIWVVGPAVVTEVRALGEGIAASIAEMEELLRRNALGAWVLDNIPEVDVVEAQQIWSRIGGIGATVLGALAAFFVTLLVGVFFAYNPQLYVAGVMRLIPLARRARAAEVLERLGVTLRWWLVGQLISMVMLWLSTWLVLHLLGVPLAFILGLLTGVLNFVPYIGPLIALIPIAMVAFLHSPVIGLIAVAAYFVLQNIEGDLIMPIVFEKTVSIPPALTVISQILMGTLMGMLGVLLATPLLAVGIVLVRMLYVEDTLGDSLEKPVEHLPNARG